MDEHAESPVLLAEDNPDDVLITQMMWGKASVCKPLITVNDGEEALKFLRKQEEYVDAPPPSLLLLDLKMPRIDGFEVLETMKNDDTLKDIPVIVLTSSERREDMERAIKLGCERYIVKPVNLDGFLKTIEEIKHFLNKHK